MRICDRCKVPHSKPNPVEYTNYTTKVRSSRSTNYELCKICTQALISEIETFIKNHIH